MKRASTQGMIGRGQQTMRASAAALGPNRYLAEPDFLKMLGLALVAHILIFGIAGLFPHEKVTSIPVRALSFKLGDQDRAAALGSSGVGTQMNTPAPVMNTTSDEAWRASSSLPTPAVPRPLRPVTHPAPKVIPVPDARQTPLENLPPAPTPQPVAAPPTPPTPAVADTVNGLPNPALLNQPAVAQTPQQYVREVGAAAPAAGLPTGNSAGPGAPTGSAEAAQQIRERYEMQISGWIQIHKLYPAAANGKEGRVVIRMRIDRSGAVRYYALEQSSGSDAIDAAAIDMIRRANPVPAVPENYPAGNLIEFLIPITFHAP